MGLATVIDLPVEELSALLADEQVSPIQIARAVLYRAERFQPALAAFAYLDSGGAIARAEGMQQSTAANTPDLFALPYGAKDVFSTATMPTRAASRLRLQGFNLSRDAALVEECRTQGANLIGKLATYEFATGGPSFDLLQPPARNPWNPARSTGGSSSGSAVAVAAGLCCFALGTDTGGSLRTPASFCGVSSIRPSPGRLRRDGIVPLAPDFDTPGIIAPRVQDCRFVMHALARRPARHLQKRTPATFRGLRLGIPADYGPDVSLHSEVKTALDRVRAIFERGGGEIRTIRLAPMWDYTAAFRVQMLHQAYALHRTNLTKSPEEYGQVLRFRLMPGRLIREKDLDLARMTTAKLRRELESYFREIDFILMPAAGHHAPLLAELRLADNFDKPQLTATFTLGCNPVVTMPAGLSSEDMPLGVQIGAATGNDEALLDFACAIEDRLPFEAERAKLASDLEKLTCRSDSAFPHWKADEYAEADASFVRLRDRLARLA